MQFLNLMIKALLLLMVFATSTGALNLWYRTYLLGRYYNNAGPFLTILGAAAPLILVVIAIASVYYIVKFNYKEWA